MRPSQILAHRGVWTRAEHRNTLPALRLAFELGFGVETDLRDASGEIVVSHDPPTGEPFLTVAELLSTYAASKSDAPLALNMKADGLHNSLLNSLEAEGISSQAYFVFDMSVPDTIGYLANRMPVYSRVSEHETQPAFLDRAIGVWVDNFTGSFPQVAQAQQFLERGYKAAIVSSELHRRDNTALWNDIAAAGLHLQKNFELCTDMPVDAFDRFGTCR